MLRLCFSVHGEALRWAYPHRRTPTKCPLRTEISNFTQTEIDQRIEEYNRIVWTISPMAQCTSYQRRRPRNDVRSYPRHPTQQRPQQRKLQITYAMYF
jgi:hypothetical protein